MYDNEYDEYMRNVLGYGYNTYPYPEDDVPTPKTMEVELEECYPDIYRLVYPMVQKACMKNTEPISKKLIDTIVEEIYTNIEPYESININVNVGNTSTVNSLSNERDTKSTTTKPEIKSKYVRESRPEIQPKKETRQRNFLLNDLIRILVLRELIGRPGRPGNMPQQRPPMRPPYPGYRPPMRPRGFDSNYGLYEY